jgi:hypothetical protein
MAGAGGLTAGEGLAGAAGRSGAPGGS